MEWTNEKCLKLIEEYSKNPALWDQNCVFHKNKAKRKEAWAAMGDKFNCSKAEVERKMNVLLTQYRREKHKVFLRCYNGAEIRSSRWYAFKKFCFLENSAKTKKRTALLYNAMQMGLSGYSNLQEATTTVPSLSWNQSISNQLDPDDNDSNDNENQMSPDYSIQDLSINGVNNHISTTQNKESSHSAKQNQNQVDAKSFLHNIKIPSISSCETAEIKDEMLDNISVKDYSMNNGEDNGESEQEYPTNYYRELNKILQRNSISPTHRFPPQNYSIKDNEPVNQKNHAKNETNNRDLNSISYKFTSSSPLSSAILCKNDCDFIGLNVALKLRGMEEYQRIIAEKLISDVLFYGQFSELDRSASICPNKNKLH